MAERPEPRYAANKSTDVAAIVQGGFRGASRAETIWRIYDELALLAASALAVSISLAVSTVPALAAAAAKDEIKVVYHFNPGDEQSTKGIRNIHNHLTADPTAKIVVVAHAAGVQFLIDGATTRPATCTSRRWRNSRPRASSSASAISR